MKFFIALIFASVCWGLGMHFFVWTPEKTMWEQIALALAFGITSAALKTIKWKKFYRDYGR